MNAFSLDPYLYDLRSELDPPDLMLWLKGELDFATEARLSEFGGDGMDDVHSIVVDLEELVFIDAAGVRVLRDWSDWHTEHQRVVSMVKATSSVRRVFRLLDSEAYLAAA